MIVKCPNCNAQCDTGEASRDDSFCGNCFASLADNAETVEHNKREIEKLKGLRIHTETVTNANG